MGEKKFYITVGIIFGIVGILHLYRAVSSWTLAVQGFDIPVWFSLVAGILILFLAYWAFRLSRK